MKKCKRRFKVIKLNYSLIFSVILVMFIFSAILGFLSGMEGNVSLDSLSLNSYIRNMFLKSVVPAWGITQEGEGFTQNIQKNMILSQFVLFKMIDGTRIYATDDKTEESTHAAAQINTSAESNAEKLPITETTVKNGTSSGISANNTGISVNNETKYSLNIDEIFKYKLSLPKPKKGAEVLIVHTHTTESYASAGKDYYTSADKDRSENSDYNMVRVGREIEKALNKAGISTIHDTSTHDIPSYNGSYKSSLASVENYIEKNPTIKVVLDIHRDSIVRSDGSKVKLTTEIKGEKVAQAMIVVGTDEGGLTHKNWKNNLSFALKIQNEAMKKYQGLMRPINVRSSRFNGHTTPNSIILEVGTSGNTLDEAILSAGYLSEIIATVIKGSR